MFGLSSETMQYLADNYENGILVSSIIVVLVYLMFSIICLYNCRKVGMKIWVLTFFPVLNIILIPVSMILGRRRKIAERRRLENEILDI